MIGRRVPSFFSLKISYKADILTLIAFVMSVVALVWQFLDYIKGADVKLLGPDQIIIGASNKMGFPNRDGGPYMHVAARMSYVNQGSTGYNATIRRELAEIELGDKFKIEQRWYRFVSADARGDDGTGLEVVKISDARAFGLLSGTSESHLTLFQPWVKECEKFDANCHREDSFLRWEKFLERLKDVKFLQVRLRAQAYAMSSDVFVTCRVELNAQILQNIGTRGWEAPVCK